MTDYFFKSQDSQAEALFNSGPIFQLENQIVSLKPNINNSRMLNEHSSSVSSYVNVQPHLRGHTQSISPRNYEKNFMEKNKLSMKLQSVINSTRE